MRIVKYIIKAQFIDCKIQRFEYSKETDKYLFTRSGDRTLKTTATHEHFDTWEQARSRLIELQSGIVARLQVRYNRERKKFTEIMDLKE